MISQQGLPAVSNFCRAEAHHMRVKTNFLLYFPYVFMWGLLIRSLCTKTRISSGESNLLSKAKTHLVKCKVQSPKYDFAATYCSGFYVRIQEQLKMTFINKELYFLAFYCKIFHHSQSPHCSIICHERQKTFFHSAHKQCRLQLIMVTVCPP